MIEIIQPPAHDAELEEARRVWSSCLGVLAENVNSQSFKTWFEPIVPLRLNAGTLTLQTPSQFFRDWLDERYEGMLSMAVMRVLGKDAVLEFEVAKDEGRVEEELELPPPAPPIQPLPKKNYPQQPDTFRTANGASQFGSQRSVDMNGNFQTFLNPRYTFDNFIKGESNQLARAAATAVANNFGGKSFNPLVIYGGTGLGKTHLVQALGNEVMKHNKSRRVIYVSSEKFTVEFVDAIQSDRVNEFSAFYRSMDILIVDDVQFFSGKEKTQDSFFHTFNELHQMGKQIVLSSDRPPKELRDLDERLLSRFQWGLTADIQPPDLETRIAILQHKSAEDGYELPGDVTEFIAANVTSNIRELEGCLISILAKSSLEGREINLDLARDVLQVVVGDVKSPINIEEIQRSVCEFFKIPEDMIRAKTRKQEIVSARQIAMYLAKVLTNSSLKTIGVHFGGRDHSTVIHAIQCVEDQMKMDSKHKANVEHLKRRLETRGRV
jgi:chromosomal replication initiator protein